MPDFVYSDEIVLSADLKELGGYHFKPDFAPDYLRGVNFITHLAVFSRTLLDAAGAYESKEFDGAQDHDLILRLTEKAQRIEHIKKVLYIWRGHAGSTAAGMEAKPYAIAAGSGYRRPAAAPRACPAAPWRCPTRRGRSRCGIS